MASNEHRKDARTPGTAPVAKSRSQLGIETRAAQRDPASAVPSITGLRLSPHGGACVLVNISTTGLLADCSERVQTGSSVTVNFEGSFTPRSVQGKVTRSSVSSMAQGRLRYHVGIAFNQPLPVESLQQAETDAPSEEAPPEAAASPGVAPSAPVVVNRW